MLVLATLAVTPVGCKQMGGWGASRLRPDAPAPQAETASGVLQTGPLAATQKADLQLALARTAEQRGEVDDAIRGYYQALENDDSRAEIYHRLAVLHDRKGDPQQAESLYLAALARAPRAAEIHCDLGYSYYLQQRWPEAETSLRAALELAPHSARTHNNLAMLLARLGRVDEAMHEFHLAGLPESQARANLALIFAMDGHLAAAHQELQVASAVDPNSAGDERMTRIRKAVYSAESQQGQERYATPASYR